MNVYAVFAGDQPGKLSQAIERSFPENHYQLTSGDWLVAADKTTQQVAKLILYGNEDAGDHELVIAGSAMIVKLDDNYWGYHNKDIWDWIDLKSRTGN